MLRQPLPSLPLHLTVRFSTIRTVRSRVGPALTGALVVVAEFAAADSLIDLDILELTLLIIGDILKTKLPAAQQADHLVLDASVV